MVELLGERRSADAQLRQVGQMAFLSETQSTNGVSERRPRSAAPAPAPSLKPSATSPPPRVWAGQGSLTALSDPLAPTRTHSVPHRIAAAGSCCVIFALPRVNHGRSSSRNRPIIVGPSSGSAGEACRMGLTLHLSSAVSIAGSGDVCQQLARAAATLAGSPTAILPPPLRRGAAVRPPPLRATADGTSSAASQPSVAPDQVTAAVGGSPSLSLPCHA